MNLTCKCCLHWIEENERHDLYQQRQGVVLPAARWHVPTMRDGGRIEAREAARILILGDRVVLGAAELLFVDETRDAIDGALREDGRHADVDAGLLAYEVHQSAEEKGVAAKEEEVRFAGDTARLDEKELCDDVAHHQRPRRHARYIPALDVLLHRAEVDLACARLEQGLGEQVELVGNRIVMKRARQRRLYVGRVEICLVTDGDERFWRAVVPKPKGNIVHTIDIGKELPDVWEIDRDLTARNGLRERSLSIWYLGFKVAVQSGHIVGKATNPETTAEFNPKRFACLVLGHVVHVNNCKWPLGWVQLRSEIR